MALRRINRVCVNRLMLESTRWFSSESQNNLEVLHSVTPSTESSVTVPTPSLLKKNPNMLHQELKTRDSSLFAPAVPQKAMTLAAFVSKSDLLQNLIKLNVDLSKIESDNDAATYLLKADFKKDIQPYILFFHDNKIPPSEMGAMFTKNPKLFMEPMEKLQLRIDYLKSKNFSQESIVRIVTKVPSVLTTSTLKTDRQLGFWQKEFKLTGDEVRYVITKFPKLLVTLESSIQANKLHLADIMGFENNEIKTMLLEDPRLLVAGRYSIAERFDYLHNTIGISHEDLMSWPSILRTRLPIIKQRHQFLKFVKRDQFNKKLENYVSLKSMVTGTDSEFCGSVAKVPVERFNDFLKTC